MSRTPIDCFVMSGGGSKGAYSAGVSMAYQYYREFNQQRANGSHSMPEVCYIGTSAGALNAVILSSVGSERLLKLWAKIRSRHVLGFGFQNPWLRTFTKLASPGWYCRRAKDAIRSGPPKSIYSKYALRRLVIRELKDVAFDELNSRANLIVCATNISTSATTSFYISKAIDRFVAEDCKKPEDKKRLGHFVRIENKEMLVECLLASTAIPLAFPPIPINGQWYVDGGIGNNIPVRDAALFQRNCAHYPELTCYQPNDVYCVKLDTPIKLSTNHSWGVDILWRSYEVFEYIHMGPILAAWHRINREVQHHDRKREEFLKAIDSLGLTVDCSKKLKEEFNSRFQSLGQSTSRRDITITEIEPSSHLGNFLSFNPKNARELMKQGFTDFINTLFHQKHINQPEKDRLLNQYGSIANMITS